MTSMILDLRRIVIVQLVLPWLVRYVRYYPHNYAQIL